MGAIGTLNSLYFRLRDKYNDDIAQGRPSSPTETHISQNSHHENCSMYGNVFRRASIALSFISNISNSKENSPAGSRTMLQNASNGIDANGKCDSSCVDKNRLSIPNCSLGNELKVPGLAASSDSSGEQEMSIPSSRKKKKKRRKNKDRAKRIQEAVEKIRRKNGIEVPEIQITQQSF